jgi:hypothetical protein
MDTTNSEMIMQLLRGNGLRDGLIGAFRRTVGQVGAVMEAHDIAEPLRMVAATDVESIHT